MIESHFIHVQRTPESLGFTVGSTHNIFNVDRAFGWTLFMRAGKVEIIEIADRHLLDVKALEPMIDSETGMMYREGDTFVAWLTGDKYPQIVFMPSADGED